MFEKTAKVNKRFERKGSRYSLYKEADATLDSKLNFRDMVTAIPSSDWSTVGHVTRVLTSDWLQVALPKDEELEDFIAYHVVDFYNRAKLTAQTVVGPNPKEGGGGGAAYVTS